MTVTLTTVMLAGAVVAAVFFTFGLSVCICIEDMRIQAASQGRAMAGQM